MATPPRAYQLWHFSRGISFTGSSPLQPSVAASTTINVDLAKEAPIPKEDDGSTRFIAPALAPTTNVRPLVAEAESVNVEAPSTSLDYRIPENIFQKARKAAKGTPDSFWTYSLYRGPLQDGEPRKVKVHYCLSKHTTERVCQYFMNEKIIGFDMEWMSYASKDHGPKPNVSLIQIASESRIGLFHVALYKGKYNDELVAPSLKRLLEDPEISKAGVNIKADCTRLNNFLGIKTRGIFELSHLHKLTKYSASGELNLIDKRVVNMASQVQEHLRLPMFKGNDVRMSNWMQPLTLSQILYCASDAYAAVQLYAVMDQKRLSFDPAPPLPYHAELGLPIRVAENVTTSSEEDDDDESDVEDEETVTTTITESLLVTVKETVCFEPETASDSDFLTAKMPRAQPTRRATASPSSSKDPRVLAAERLLARYRGTVEKLRAPPAAIRSYYIWQTNEDLSPESIAKLLREPPLLTTTVAGYILQTIMLEKLPFHEGRLRSEVLCLIPKDMVQLRYASLAYLVKEPPNKAA